MEPLPAFGAAVRVAPAWWVPYRNLALLKVEAKDIPGAIASYETGIRAAIVTKLVRAIDDVESRVKKAGWRSRKGSGGVSPKVRLYQLLGGLVETLDGVLKNAKTEELEAKFEEVEKAVEELRRSQTGRSN